MAVEIEDFEIIGTHRAMQILKDGDLVEVDAERGVVTILESNKTKQKRNR